MSCPSLDVIFLSHFPALYPPFASVLNLQLAPSYFADGPLLYKMISMAKGVLEARASSKGQSPCFEHRTLTKSVVHSTDFVSEGKNMTC